MCVSLRVHIWMYMKACVFACARPEHLCARARKCVCISSLFMYQSKSETASFTLRTKFFESPQLSVGAFPPHAKRRGSFLGILAGNGLHLSVLLFLFSFLFYFSDQERVAYHTRHEIRRSAVTECGDSSCLFNALYGILQMLGKCFSIFLFFFSFFPVPHTQSGLLSIRIRTFSYPVLAFARRFLPHATQQC